jgi:hypothetical protein
MKEDGNSSVVSRQFSVVSNTKQTAFGGARALSGAEGSRRLCETWVPDQSYIYQFNFSAN